MSTIKVTDKRRFDSEGQPRENDAPKCGDCNGLGHVAVDPSPENQAILDERNAILALQGKPLEEMPATVDCPACDGRGRL